MLVDQRGALDQGLEGIGAERERGGEADRRPQRIAATDAWREGKDAGLVDAELDRLIGRGGEGDQASIGVLDARLLEPGEGGIGVAQRFGGGEGLRGDGDQRGRRIEAGERFVDRLAIDVREDLDLVAPFGAAEGVDQQRGTEGGAADADVKDAGNVAEGSGFDRIDQIGRASCRERVCSTV